MKSPRPIISVPTLANATGFPARSISTSTATHIVLVIALLLIRFAPTTREDPSHLRQLPESIDLRADATTEPILPDVKSSSPAASSPASASSRSASGLNAPSSASSMPLIHQRRQHIISNTADATNSVQTILQPDLEHPPRLTAAIPIPSMIRMAAVQRPPSLTAPTLTAVVKPAAPPAPPAPVTPPALPKVKPATVDTVPLTSATQLADAPKLAAFPTTGRAFDPPKPPPPPVAAAAKPSAPAASPSSAPTPPSTAKSGSGTDARNLLVVNAFEVQSTISERDIPAAELHGRFEVTASPTLPDGPTTGGSSSTAGVSDAGLANSGSGAGKGASHSSGSGAGAAGTHANGAGGGTSNLASLGNGKGHGVGTGEGEGAGHGLAGTGSGTGNGSGGSGSSPFPGMTIVGGTSGNGMRSAASNGTVDVHDPHGAYGLTILSSGGSGGAVRDLGVFSDGPVYTVYLDVSKLGIRGRWSLQYGASREVRNAHPGVALTPPFAEDQRLPRLPPAAVAANVGRVVVIQANLKPDGTLDGFRVLESPDQRLNEGLIVSLTHWYFEAAAMGSEKVAVKVLLGIPIAAPMADTGDSQQADQRIPAAAAPRSSAQ